MTGYLRQLRMICAMGLACLLAGCSFISARFTRTDPVVLPAEVSDLPIVAVDPIDGEKDTRFAIWLSGDGGWGDMERQTTALMARRGVPTAGVNTLRYFWDRRSPEEAARAVERIERAFSARWRRSRFILIGFSFGADMAPLVAERLRPDVRAQLDSAVLLSPTLRASLQVSPRTWLGFGGEHNVEQTIASLTSVPIVCARGVKAAAAACPKTSKAGLRVVVLPGGHSLQDDWPMVAQLALGRASADSHPIKLGNR
ncbi:MAG TPA: AcvB/VirJ family lysyl-phosphatidylglycerol hydrolase [Caulobacterales bacterium]|nr:AcvB/VirJ family lysyl-phosphatidylglycerol hydrolase [Caulobacterales bacterium]